LNCLVASKLQFIIGYSHEKLHESGSNNLYSDRERQIPNVTIQGTLKFQKDPRSLPKKAAEPELYT
jgi:hypothetical protein